MEPTRDLLNQPGGLTESLQKMRKAAGLTQVTLAEATGWPSSKVSKIETGQQIASEDDIRAWCAACGQPEAAGELLDLLAGARSAHRQYRLRSSHAAIQSDLDKLVRSARLVRNYELVFIPGLLQTPDYARGRALEAVRVHGFPEDGVEAAVTARMRRQEVLYTGRQFEFVIHETAIRVKPRPAAAMPGQLDRLLSVSGLSNVTLGIIPFAAEFDVSPAGGFMLLDEIAYVEDGSGERIISGGREAETWLRIGDGLSAEAVTGNEARDLIVSASAFLRGVG